jgi:GTP cyclohydrolase I
LSISRRLATITLLLNLDTPLREDAFDMSDVDKIKKIAHHFSEIMQTMGLDLSDDSLSGTPLRVAKMYVKEVFSGLDPKNKPTVKLFENTSMAIKRCWWSATSRFTAFCEHHFVPIIGKAHIAYLNNGQVVGLSKLNRIVDYFSRRPQVQERLTVQIANELKQLLHTEDIAVILDAKHMCVSLRGVEDVASSTLTASYHGAFQLKEVKEEFLQYVYGKK